MVHSCYVLIFPPLFSHSHLVISHSQFFPSPSMYTFSSFLHHHSSFSYSNCIFSPPIPTSVPPRSLVPSLLPDTQFSPTIHSELLIFFRYSNSVSPNQLFFFISFANTFFFFILPFIAPAVPLSCFCSSPLCVLHFTLSYVRFSSHDSVDLSSEVGRSTHRPLCCYLPLFVLAGYISNEGDISKLQQLQHRSGKGPPHFNALVRP